MKRKVVLIAILLTSLNFVKVGSSTLVTDYQKRVLDKYNYKIEIVEKIEDSGNWGFNPAGLFIENEKTIQLDSKYFNWAFNHEYGHFIDSINYNISISKAFNDIYLKEKDSFVSKNTKYARSSNIEYFASCYKMYLENPDQLKNMCEETYIFISKLRTE